MSFHRIYLLIAASTLLQCATTSLGAASVPSPSTLSSPVQYLPYDVQFSEFSAGNIVLQKLTVPLHDTVKEQKIDAANVLILHPIYAGSHEVVVRGMGVELVKRGHKVTQLRWMSDHQPIDIRKHVPGTNSSVFGQKDNAFLGDSRANETTLRHMDIITVSVQNRDLR